MRLTLKNLQDLAKSKGLVVKKTNGSLYKYEICKVYDSSKTIYARNAGETQYEIENWGQS
jgi:hypothetical protein